MSDQLAVTGAADLSQVKFTLAMDGFISHGTQDGISTYAALYGGRDVLGVLYNPGSYDTSFTSGSFAVVNGKVDFSFALNTYIGFDMAEMYDNRIQRDVSVDFGNTLKILAISGFNSQGEAVSLTSALGSTGFAYQVPGASAVPEPTTWALMICGFGMIGGNMRSRKMRTGVTFA